MFHCLDISKHISTSELFFIISISCFVFFFLDFNFENNCPGGGVLARFLCFRGRRFALSLGPGGVGNSPFQKNSPKVCLRGMVKLGIDSYINEFIEGKGL